MLPLETLAELLRLAVRAPSPHNIQPWIWRIDGTRVELHEDPRRWLRTGDPRGRDNQLSLGAAWEGLSLALSRQQLGISLPEVEPLTYPPASHAPRLAARGSIIEGAEADPLADWLDRRRSFRGTFAAATSEQRELLHRWAGIRPQITLIENAEALRAIGIDYDCAAAEGLRDLAFARELHGWMRFSARDPRAAQDGLSADCLCLSRPEAIAASLLMKPRIASTLARIGLGGLLVSEAAKLRSATAALLFSAPAGASSFDTGRAFHRFWLELDREGFSGVPMSALSDHPGYSRRLIESHPLPTGHTLVSILRVGPTPEPLPASSARLTSNHPLL